LKKVYRAIRYSAVGLFCAGIISTITSCTDQEQIAALLLILALYLSGGGGNDSEEPAAPDPSSVIIFEDTFDFAQGPIATADCSSNSGSNIAVDGTLPFGGRQMLLNVGGTNTASGSIESAGGTLTFIANGSGHCRPTLRYPSNVPVNPRADHTAVAKAVFEIAAGGVGAPVYCSLTEDYAGSDLRAWSVFLDPATPGTMTLNAPTNTSAGFDPSAVGIVYFSCNEHNAVGTLIMDRIALEG